MPILSIIIPMYNVAHFLEKCVDSALNQNLKSDNFEILMIDDGSPDNSCEVAKNLAKIHHCIQVITQKNKGLGGARNTGINYAKGKYLLFLDADDILIENKIYELIILSETYKLEILEFGATQIDGHKNTLAKITHSSLKQVYDGIDYYKKIKYMNSACNKLYLTTFIKKNNLKFTEKIYSEDFEFNARAFFFAKRIMATDIIGASFLQSSNSITRNKNKDKKNKFVNDFVVILENINNFRIKHQSSNDVRHKTYFNERMTMCNLGLFYFLFKNNYPFNKFKKVKLELQKKNLFYDSFPVSEKNRELFRKVMLKNFYLFSLTQPLKKFLGLKGMKYNE